MRFCRGFVRYCHYNRSCYRVEDFWGIKCWEAGEWQGDLTSVWEGCYSSTCFSQGPSAKILMLSPTKSARGWNGTGCSCSTGQSEEVLKILHILLLGVKQGLSELAVVIMDLSWERAPSLAQCLKFVVLASPAYPAKDPAFPTAVSWKLLHTGSFLKYELSKINSVYYLPVAQTVWWCLAWELQSLWLKFNTKILLWHFAVLETCQDLMWLCLNISAACPGPENAGCFCWCENGGRGQRLWTLSSPTS